ncbi:MAG: cation diffusion facilitator family transporter [Bacteroidales bacterium]|nr:cation diffusion facilitator family transporter [Bacteroidales bacterium]
MQEHNNNKSRAARLSIWSNSFLIVLNTLVGLFSGSVSILSEAIHTFIDLLASVMAYFSVKISETPADEGHPYGHGKFENVSGVVEALLIFVASAWIIFHSVSRLLEGNDNIGHLGLGLGFVVMLLSAGINLIVSRKIYKVAKETDSVALKADALHLSTHVYTSAGVGISLLVIYFTGWHFLDPVAAIVVASYILKEAFEILIEAYRPLTDKALPAEELHIINKVIQKHIPGPGMGYHMLRTRKAGSGREVDFHLEVPGNMTVSDSHDLCDRIEEEINEKLPAIKVTIHVEPWAYHDLKR